MINRAVGKRPISSFSTPMLAEPKEVEKARLAFGEIADRDAATRGAHRDEREALKAAEVADRETATAAYVQGGDPRPPLTAQADAVRARLAAIDEQLPALSAAVDSVGNTLAAAIAEQRDSWLEDLAQAETDAAATFDTALAAARNALADLAEARQARIWIADFDLALAEVGQQVQFAGGRVPPVLSHEPGLRGEHDPRVLLKLLSLATDPPPTRAPLVTAGF